MASYVSIWENSYIRQFLQLRRPKVRRHKTGPMSSSAFLFFTPFSGLTWHGIRSVRSCTAASPLIFHVKLSDAFCLVVKVELLTAILRSGSDKVERIQICTKLTVTLSQGWECAFLADKSAKLPYHDIADTSISIASNAHLDFLPKMLISSSKIWSFVQDGKYRLYNCCCSRLTW